MDNGPSRLASSTQTAPFPRKYRPRFSRTKTGCWSCRRRRKRCDEKRPTCTACLRNKFCCTWPEPEPELEPEPEPEPQLEPEPSCTASAATATALLPLQKSRGSCLPENSNPCIPIEFDPPLLLPSIGPNTSQAESASTEDADEDVMTTVPMTDVPIWTASPSSFMSLQRATLLSTASPQLLTHYIERTSNLITTKPLRNNKFVTFILPLAGVDDLLMHAVLAVSGTHLNFMNEAAPDIRHATSAHYGMVLRSLYQAFSTLSDRSTTQILRLLLVLILLCHVEVRHIPNRPAETNRLCQAISGNTHGAIFPHLRATRQLILDLQKRLANGGLVEDKKLQGFVLEVYAYLALVSNIIPYGIVQERTLPLDPFITSLGGLKEYETFGIFFGCCHSLFELIPSISVLATKRLREEELSMRSEETVSMYNGLLSRLEEWRAPPLDPEMAEWKSAHIATGKMYRHALFAYLKAAMCGSVVDNPKVIYQLQQHIDEVWPILDEVRNSPYGTTILWPLLIIGSCVVREDQRHSLRNRLESPGQWRMSQVIQALRLLNLLWDSNDRHAFGPYGLYFTMKEHGINFCMA